MNWYDLLGQINVVSEMLQPQNMHVDMTAQMHEQILEISPTIGSADLIAPVLL